MRRSWWMAMALLMAPGTCLAQHAIVIDGDFDDWNDVPVAVSDPSGDVHDTDWFSDGLPDPSSRPRDYSDVDVLEVKFTNDAENLYCYLRASGRIGRTSSPDAGHGKAGRYYFIITIDADDDTSTGYRLAEGNYWPDSTGYDVNMEVEFYDGSFNTGHYINHEFLNELALSQGRADLSDGILRLAPGTYDWYLQWVTFDDCSYVEVADRGPVYQGVIEIAVSPDGEEAEMNAPMWGFLQSPEGQRILDVGQTIVVSASLEGSGELSEEAVAAGHTTGSRSFWGSDTAEPFRYAIVPSEIGSTMVDCDGNRMPDTCDLRTGRALDCNGNSVPDSCDIEGGTSLDCDANTVPDECEVTVSCGLQMPGDCNQDGALDLSDGICLLGHLFRGDPVKLPCGDGTLGDAADIRLLDSNGDGGVDLSDAVGVFGFLFLGTPPPVLGTECVPIVGCPAVARCG